MKVTKCKACGAPIIFILSPGGKAIPCDAEAVHYWKKAGARGKCVTPNGIIVSCEFEGDIRDVSGIGFRAHFASCPQAASFRRRGKE